MIIKRGRVLLGRGLIAAALLGMLLGIAALYTQPRFLVTLADQVWSCF